MYSYPAAPLVFFAFTTNVFFLLFFALLNFAVLTDTFAHFAVIVRSAVTGAAKSYAVVPAYQPSNVYFFLTGSAGFAAAALM